VIRYKNPSYIVYGDKSTKFIELYTLYQQKAMGGHPGIDSKTVQDKECPYPVLFYYRRILNCLPWVYSHALSFR